MLVGGFIYLIYQWNTIWHQMIFGWFNIDEIEKEIYENSTIEEGRYPRENKHSIDPIKSILAKTYLEEIQREGSKALCNKKGYIS